MSNPSLDNALAFAEYGFPVFPVWGIHAGICRCPKGSFCTSPGKHPIPPDGLKAGTTDVSKLTKMLAAPGSGGNYGIVPAEHVAVIDIDGEDWVAKVKELGLPPTLMTLTANGCHLWYRWPDDIPMPTRLHGFVVRSQEHPGYVIGPGSTHQTGFVYRLAHQNGHDIYTMLGRIAPFPVVNIDNEQLSLTVGPGLAPPERVPTGSRHDYLRDRARTLRGGGLTGDSLLQAMLSINARLPEPKTQEEVERAIGDVETKFGEDPAPIDVGSIPTSTLWIDVADFLASLPTDIEWVSPLAAYGFVSLIAGPPKAGKSTLVANLLAAREANEAFLWGSAVPSGPSALVTEEGGFAVARKVKGLTRLSILTRQSFALAGLSKLDHLLATLTTWLSEQEGKALVVIDTLAVWGDIEDENDAAAATRAIAALALLAQVTDAAIVLVHHARKGGGDHGEAIRGSGALFATVDQAIELSYATGRASDDRRLALSGRLIYAEEYDLVFDRATNGYSVSTVPYTDPWQLDQFPVDGSGIAGLRREDAEGLWGLAKGATNKRLSSLIADGRLVRREVHTPGERMPHPEYGRPAPLLVFDTRSVGERMADIFSGDES